MILDKNLQFSLGQSLAAAVGDIVSTNVLDTEAAQDEGIGEPIQFLWDIVTALTSAGAATVQFVVQSSPDNSTWTDQEMTQAYAYNAAAVQPGAQPIVLKMSPGLQRYVRTVVRVAGAATTGGTGSSFAVKDSQLYQFGKSGFTVV